MLSDFNPANVETEWLFNEGQPPMAPIGKTEIPLPVIDNPVYGDSPTVHYPTERHSSVRHRAACDSLAPWATKAREVNARMDSETSDAFRDALQAEAN